MNTLPRTWIEQYHCQRKTTASRICFGIRIFHPRCMLETVVEGSLFRGNRDWPTDDLTFLKCILKELRLDGIDVAWALCMKHGRSQNRSMARNIEETGTSVVNEDVYMAKKHVLMGLNNRLFGMVSWLAVMKYCKFDCDPVKEK